MSQCFIRVPRVIKYDLAILQTPSHYCLLQRPSYSILLLLSTSKPPIKLFNRNPNHLVQESPLTAFTNRNKRPISSSSQSQAHTRPLLCDSLNILQRNVPLACQTSRSDQQDPSICHHDDHIFLG